MNRLFIIASIVLTVALAGAAVYAYMLLQERDELETELALVKNALADTQQELSQRSQTLAATESTLTSTLVDLNNTAHELTIVQTELDETENTLNATRGELTAAKAELSVVNNTLTQTEADYTEVSQKLELANETLGGLNITVAASLQCDDVELIDNPQATDPTWAELKAFLAADKTEEHEYIRDVYDCSQFSRDVHNNAEAAGIRCAEVNISFVNNRWEGHALNAFLTTDYGLVYVDCTPIGPDKVAKIVSGKEYMAVSVANTSITSVRNESWWNNQWYYYSFEAPEGGNEVVAEIIIYW